MRERPAARRVIKPHIAIVGTGSLGTALASALRDAGYVIDEIISRGRASSLRKARRLAAEVGASTAPMPRAQIRADVVWFCVPDGAIASAAASLSNATDWHGKVALHASGALTSDELVKLRSRGASVASVHPLMTFVPGSQPPLARVPFAIEGGQKAARAARTIVLNLGGRPFPIEKRYKQAYHAWGMFVSPLLTALLAASERVAKAAGVQRSAAKRRMLPILRQTLANYAALGASHSFSGPIARGDVETIEKHLSVLRVIPEARNIYMALARTALRDLPVGKNRTAMEKILKK
ncbi:MAG TPA: Rossmann-like and DUF2520 domain-containing protein [Candidatus Deferrimicrobiaceae bacterium]|nr:Rossmann-like and DUF2520 domain-containing protein [Candidatus Deferrimicrobiaceae bacterium]